MNKKKLRFDDFGITGKRYKELCGFCEQYPDWKKELDNHAYISAVRYDDEPKPSNHDNNDTTAKHALKMLKYHRNIDMIEKCAQAVDKDLWEFIIRSACYNDSYEYLHAMRGLYLGRSAFYEKKRYFFYLLDIEKKHEYERTVEILDEIDRRKTQNI